MKQWVFALPGGPKLPLPGGARRSLGFDQADPFDSWSILGVDDELPTIEGEMIAYLGNASGK